MSFSAGGSAQIAPVNANVGKRTTQSDGQPLGSNNPFRNLVDNVGGGPAATANREESQALYTRGVFSQGNTLNTCEALKKDIGDASKKMREMLQKFDRLFEPRASEQSQGNSGNQGVRERLTASVDNMLELLGQASQKLDPQLQGDSDSQSALRGLRQEIKDKMPGLVGQMAELLEQRLSSQKSASPEQGRGQSQGGSDHLSTLKGLKGDVIERLRLLDQREEHTAELQSMTLKSNEAIHLSQVLKILTDALNQISVIVNDILAEMQRTSKKIANIWTGI